MKHGMKQEGIVLVFALLMLVTLTVLGVSAVSSSLIQNKMAVSMESQSIAFDAAESALAGVVFESEDDAVLSSVALLDPLSEARVDDAIDLDNQELSCYEDNEWTNREVTSAGLPAGIRHTTQGTYKNNPTVRSWSRSAFVREQACRGSSNVIGGSNISCHVFMIRGCGQLQNSNFAVANTLNVSVFAPASGNQ
ncbi:pilus assembly protein PilZ [Alteromonadaceae bacterium M269]|nr:pilus assembly protein PilZ [Alteromonadaceae bacterium M269]